MSLLGGALSLSQLSGLTVISKILLSPQAQEFSGLHIVRQTLVSEMSGKKRRTPNHPKSKDVFIRSFYRGREKRKLPTHLGAKLPTCALDVDPDEATGENGERGKSAKSFLKAQKSMNR